MRGIIFGAMLASVVWGFFAGGREQLIKVWYAMNPPTISKPVDIAERIDAMKIEREQAFIASYKGGNGCERPKTELAQLECRNQMDMARRSYYTRWNSANASRLQN